MRDDAWRNGRLTACLAVRNCLDGDAARTLLNHREAPARASAVSCRTWRVPAGVSPREKSHESSAARAVTSPAHAGEHGAEGRTVARLTWPRGGAWPAWRGGGSSGDRRPGGMAAASAARQEPGAPRAGANACTMDDVRHTAGGRPHDRARHRVGSLRSYVAVRL